MASPLDSLTGAVDIAELRKQIDAKELQSQALNKEVQSHRRQLNDLLLKDNARLREAMESAVQLAKEREEILQREKRTLVNVMRVKDEEKEKEYARNKQIFDLAQIVLEKIEKVPPMVDIIVGGTKFSTSPGTLFKQPESVLATTLVNMLKEDPRRRQMMIDRDPKHFDKILNYLRDGNESLVWMEDDTLTTAELKVILQEAKFYELNDLVREISLVIVTRKPLPSSIRIGEACKFVSATLNIRGTPTIVYYTRSEKHVIEENFSNCKFVRVTFRHIYHFNLCNFSNVTFQDCDFQAVQDFGSSQMRGVAFVNCKGIMSPKDILLVDRDMADYIPDDWQ